MKWVAPSSTAQPEGPSLGTEEPESLRRTRDRSRRRVPGALFWGLFFGLLLFDQGTKAWILAHGDELPLPLIPGLLNLVSVRNTGIVFGLFSGHNWLWIAAGASFLFAGFLIGRRLDWSRRRNEVIASFLAAGAAGNISDRIVHGFVVDWIDAYVGTSHWPSFNVADSCLCLVSLWMIFRLSLLPRSRS